MTSLLTQLRDGYAASRYKNTTRLVWLTVGNEGCNDTVQTVMPPESSKQFRVGPYSSQYRDIYSLQNSTIKFWSDVPFASVLDVRPLWMRPDAMVGGENCVHVCLPGPLLLVGRMLQEMITHVHPLKL